MAFRLIPPGSFRMGSRGHSPAEEPVHRVEIAEAFWLGETPVTQAQFRLWTQAEKIHHENEFEDRPEHPAESLHWRQALAYCAWLAQTQARQFPEGFTLACLPTEAEWEYACRAGTESEYHTGDGAAALAEAGWFGEDLDRGSTHPVGRKAHNAFHLYDLHGNVWEWCRDVYDGNAYRKRADGWEAREWTLQDAGDDADYFTNEDRAVGENGTRVLRGGSWCYTARDCRSAYRLGDRPGFRIWSSGFRVCLVCGLAVGRGAQPETVAESDGAGGVGATLPDLASAKLPRAVGRNNIPKK